MQQSNRRVGRCGKRRLSQINITNVLLVFLIMAVGVFAVGLMGMAFTGVLSFSRVYPIFKNSKGILVGVVPTLAALGVLDFFRKSGWNKTISLLIWLAVTSVVCVIVGAVVLEDGYECERQEDKSDSFKFSICFDDPFLLSYQTSELRNHKSALKHKFIEAIKDSNENNLNAADADYDAYAMQTRTVREYEEAYIILRKKGLFENAHRDERVQLNNKSIQHRLEANKNYKTSENQRLLMARYDDGVDECYSQQQYEEALEQFSCGLYWGFTGTSTAYEEENGRTSVAKSIIDDMIKVYKKIYDYDGFLPDMHNRAEILIEVLKHVKDEL